MITYTKPVTKASFIDFGRILERVLIVKTTKIWISELNLRLDKPIDIEQNLNTYDRMSAAIE